MPIDPRMVKWDASDTPAIDPRMVKWESAPTQPVKIGKDAFADTLRDELRGTDWITRNVAGAGTALSNLVEGVKQFAGKGNQQTIENNQIIADEAPVGSIAGNVALTAIPFGVAGNSVRAAGAVGAGVGLAQPVSGEQTLSNIAKGKAMNTAIGGATGAGGQAVANKAGSWLSEKAAQMLAKRTADEPLNATIREAVEAGYTIPPGNVNPSFINRQLESMGGKIATQQMASSKNVEVTDRLARRAAGLPENAPITPNSLKAVRDQLGKVYDDVGQVVGKDAVEQLKVLRADANQYWNMQMRNPHPDTLKLAKETTNAAKALEKQIDDGLKAAKQGDLVDKFKEARKNIAINHTVENALVEGGGTIDSRSIARAAQRGDPLSGDLATIGNFANNFPKITQPDKMVGTPDAHNLKYMLSLAMGGGGYAAGDNPAYAALGVLPMLSGPAARSMMFRKGAQQALANPSYQVPIASRMTGGLLKYSPVTGTALAMESLR